LTYRLRILTTLAVACSLLAQERSDRRIQPVGAFSNMRFTEEHAYGTTVELWRDGISLIGLLLVSEGLQGDTPTGILENVKFDARTGALSFNAKLTTGMLMLPGDKEQPSLELFQFTGALKPALLTGTLKRSDLRQPSHPASEERVQLKSQPQATVAATTYGEWLREVQDILKFRGPKP